MQLGRMCVVVLFAVFVLASPVWSAANVSVVTFEDAGAPVRDPSGVKWVRLRYREIRQRLSHLCPIRTTLHQSRAQRTNGHWNTPAFLCRKPLRERGLRLLHFCNGLPQAEGGAGGKMSFSG